MEHHIHGTRPAIQPGAEAVGLAITSAGHFHTNDHICGTRKRDDHLLLLVTAGQGDLTLAHQNWTVGGGSWFWIAPRQEHAYRCDPRRGWNLLYVHFEGALANRCYRACGLSLRHPLRPNVPDLKIELRHLVHAVVDHGDPHGLTAIARLYRILLMCVDQETNRPAAQEAIAPALSDELPSVEAMAAVCGLSVAHFSRAFRQAMGTSPWEWVLTRRMERAQELLSTTAQPIAAVAAACHFDDPDYFSRIFKKRSGCSPRAWRMRS